MACTKCTVQAHMYIELQLIHNVRTQLTNTQHNANGNANHALQSNVHKTTNNVKKRSRFM